MKEFLEWIWNMPMSTFGEQMIVALYVMGVYAVIAILFFAYKVWWKK
jgi:hypothetical protein|tara:strand:+ start:711 stop:851 length:141 start_codon:yes stop_codon:yes gene_type:complete